MRSFLTSPWACGSAVAPRTAGGAQWGGQLLMQIQPHRGSNVGLALGPAASFNVRIAWLRMSSLIPKCKPWLNFNVWHPRPGAQGLHHADRPQGRVSSYKHARAVAK